MRYTVHDSDYYISGRRFIIAWKLYPINEHGQIIDEDNTRLYSSGELNFTSNQLFSPSGRVDIPSSDRVEYEIRSA